MRLKILASAFILCGLIGLADAAPPRGGGGGGRPAGGGGGRAMPSRSAAPRAPAARPSAPRPSAPRAVAPRPSAPQSRPSVGARRPQSIPQRPNVSQRPNISQPQSRPNVATTPRPNGAPRPNLNPPGQALANRPNVNVPNRPTPPTGRPANGQFVNRPGQNGRPNQPAFVNGRPAVNPNINGQNFNNWNRTANWHGNWNNKWNNNWNNNWHNNGYWRGNWNGNGWYRPWYGYHNGWFNGYWNWYRSPGWWVGFGLGWLGGFANSSFYNPYYVPTGTPVFNYYEPIPCVPSESLYQTPVTPYVDSAVPPTVEVPADKPVDQPEDPKVREAGTIFNSARDAFRAGNYDRALTTVDKAVRVLPNDAALHEFRALTYFAQKKYQDAAGVIYSVLAVGPGWDWQTVKTFYPNTQAYTQQLGDLQKFVKDNPRDPAGQFLLAYHCLVLDQRKEAATLLKRVAELNPQDKLASELVKALENSSTTGPDDRPKVNP